MNRTRRTLWVALGAFAVVSWLLAVLFLARLQSGQSSDIALGVALLLFFLGLAALTVAGKTRAPDLWVRAVGLSSAIALGVSVVVMWIAWQHNPQGEFHEQRDVSWGSWLYVGASWYVVTFVLFATTTWGVLQLVWRGPRPPSNSAVNPPHSAVTALAQSSKRRAAGRAGYR